METAKTLTFSARGLVFLSFAEWLRLGKRGEEFEALKEVLPAENFELLSSADKSRKYPIALLSNLLNACREKLLFDKGLWEDFGAHLCKTSLHTKFGGLASYLDPVTFVMRVPLFWSRYFEGSKLDVDEVGSNGAVLRLREPAGIEELMPLFAGWLIEALKMMEADEVAVDAQNYSWRLSWVWSA